MRRFIVYSVLSLLFMATACNKDVELETALSLSGENRAELESALEHFKDDQLKYEAVRFLIVNMIGAYSYDDELKSICEPFYCKYDSLMRIHGYDSLLRIFDYGKMKLWDKQVDSLWNDFNLQNADKIIYKKICDLQYITAQQLISEVELAFEAWQKNVYSRSCSFDEFCEYILPYRHRNGLMIDEIRKNLNELHKKDFFVTGNKRMTDEIDSLLFRYRHITHSGFAGMDIPILDFQTMVRLRHGLCEQRCWFNTILLSSLGIACATDFVPAWGNRNNSHTWNIVIKDGESYAFEPFWDEDRWKYKEIYNNRSCDSMWGRYRLPKVYRHTYKRYIEGPISDSEESIENIPHLFRDVHKKDVSKEYFETKDVTLKIPDIDETVRYVYLCVLNYGSWCPVQWGKVCNERVTFSDMGKGILYLPMYCKNGIMIPCGLPFVLQKSGKIEYIEPKQKTEDIAVSHFSGALAFVKNKEFFKYLRGVVLLNKDNDTLCKLPQDMELNSVKVKTKCERPTRTIKMKLIEQTVALGRIEFFTNQKTD